MAITTTPTLLKPSAAEPADSPTGQPDGGSPKKRTGVLRWVLLAAGLLLLAGIGGGIYFARHHGFLSRTASTTAQSKKSVAPPSKNSVPQTTIDLPLEPFVVNLADAGGHSYARIGLSLHIAMPAPSKKDASTESAAAASELSDMVRDRIIGVLNRQQSADLLAPDGKENLKQAIRAAVAAKDPQIKVIDIYFTEFLVQS